MASLQYGSSGSQVKKMQDWLGQLGYSAGSDGIYGTDSQNAVKQFQQDYGLEGTGVFDQNTLDKLFDVRGGNATKVNNGQGVPSTPSESSPSTSTGSTGTSTAGTSSSGMEYDPRYGVTAETQAQLDALAGGYTPSEAVQQAQAALEAAQAKKPGEYQSAYDDLIKDLYGQIVNRGKFEYDINGDALYDIYKDQYTHGGQMAMMDTLGQAAALTGGYDNSYAQAVGQQAYQQYMAELAGMVPELEQRAYERWQAVGDDLYNRYGLAKQEEEDAYNRYRDTYGDWLNELELAYNKAQDADEKDYNRYRDDLSYWQNQASTESNNYWNQKQMEQQNYWNEQQLAATNRSNAYSMAMDMITQGVLPSSDMLSQAGISEADARSLLSSIQSQMAAAAAAKSSSSGSSGRSSGSSSSSSTSSGKTPTVAQMEKALELYNKGGMDNCYAYMDSLEANGYDVNSLYDYLMKHGTYTEPGEQLYYTGGAWSGSKDYSTNHSSSTTVQDPWMAKAAQDSAVTTGSVPMNSQETLDWLDSLNPNKKKK